MNNCTKCNSELKKIYEVKFHDVFECPECNYQKIISIDDCCRNPFKIVIIDRTKKVDRLLKQCINCGGIVNRNHPLSFKKYSEEIRDEINEYRFDEWKQNISIEYQYVNEDVANNNSLNSKRGKYRQYLNSENWKEKRKLVLKRDNNKCQVCKIKDAEEVHHLTYDNIYNEKLEDLISICSECHDEIHEKERLEKMNEISEKIKSNKKTSANNV